ncbi:MAG: hypothetical protein ACREJC_03005 [Tepidisphaeraceae bacterium]
MPVSDYQQKNAASADLTSAALHGLANAGIATLAEYDNSAAANLNHWADFELVLDAEGAGIPNAGSWFELHFLVAPDGTNYSTAATLAQGITQNLFAGNWILQALGINRVVLRDVALPSYKLKPYIYNASGVATAAVGGSSVKMFPRRRQGVI